MAGPVSGDDRSQSKAISWHLLEPSKDGRFWVPSLSPEILLGCFSCSQPSTLVQHSSRPKPWQEMGRCKQLALRTVGNHLEDMTGARESLTTRRDRDGEVRTGCGCRRVTRERPLRRKTAPTTGTFSFEHRQNPRDWGWRCPETVSKPVPQPHFTGSV